MFDGEFRRTHYTGEVTPEMDGEEIVLCGWVHELRDLGGIKFILLRDREGLIQLTISRKEASPDLLEIVDSLKKEYVIAVRGIVRSFPKAPRGVEVKPLKIRILNRAEHPLPLDVTEKVKADLDTRLDARFMDLRRPRVAAIFKISSVMYSAAREFLISRGFWEVHTPKIVAAATEGGAELFPVAYFEREAFLSQSPQLYKQMLMAAGFDKVFEIAPAFRAEEHNTRRHLNEFISLDVEMSFADHEDVMRVLEELVRYCVEKVVEMCERELELLGAEPEIPETPFPRITYDEALEIVRSKGVDMRWGEDFPTAAEKALGEEMGSYYFIVDWPRIVKPFYAHPKEDDDRLCNAFDLMYRELELASGTQRIHEYDLLVESLREKGLNVESFRFYLEAFRYGMPPHAGFGLGPQRLLMVLTGAENIREVVLFPRDRNRLTP